MNWYNRFLTAGLDAWDQKDFLKKLKKDYGVVFLRHGKGDDQIWGNPETGKRTVIPVSSGAKEINPYTMTIMLKNLGIPLKDFKKRHFKKQTDPIPQTEPVQQTPQKVPDWQKQPWYIEQQKMLQQTASVKSAKWKDNIPGGLADGKMPSNYEKSQVEKGKEIEFEHTDDPDTAREIAMDHLEEHPDYYNDKTGLPAMEEKLEKNKK